ncbi:MAG: cytochrome c3 family protein [Desulfobacteraceae bacterium]|nr:cytochrome c3 family protein [Desulfobacteraceae bacterium]
MAFAQPVRANTCLGECHADIAKVADRHAPVAEDCLSCHRQTAGNHPAAKGNEFSLAAAGPALCFKCHDPLPQGKQHAPVAEGKCTACHDPHGGSGRALLATSGAPQNQREVCFRCHPRERFSKPFPHGPVAMGACTVCHDPHASANPALLRKSGRKICLGCHADFAQGLRKAAFVHSAVKEKECTTCHEPHGGDKPALLKEDMRELCFGCHQDIKELVERGKSRHEPISGEGSCGSCHLVHYGDHPNLLFKEEKALCLQCHGGGNGAPPAGGRDIEKEISGKKYLHGPLAEGKCTPCHDPHASRFASLLKGEYPGTFYAGYREGLYDFCFGCHDKNLLKEGSTATGFRDGTRNLHALHVVRDVKGRTCMACHAPHASDSAKLITKEGVPFGSWRVPLRFEKTDTGGSCAPGCHRKMEYKRK